MRRQKINTRNSKRSVKRHPIPVKERNIFYTSGKNKLLITCQASNLSSEVPDPESLKQSSTIRETTMKPQDQVDDDRVKIQTLRSPRKKVNPKGIIGETKEIERLNTNIVSKPLEWSRNEYLMERTYKSPNIKEVKRRTNRHQSYKKLRNIGMEIVNSIQPGRKGKKEERGRRLDSKVSVFSSVALDRMKQTRSHSTFQDDFDSYRKRSEKSNFFIFKNIFWEKILIFL